MKALSFALALVGLAAAANAQPINGVAGPHPWNGGAGKDSVIVDQQPDGVSPGVVAQAFPDFPDFSTQQFDDFSTNIDYFVETLTIYGVEQGNSGFNVSVKAKITTTANFNDAGVMSATGTQVGSNLVLDFGGQVLPAGDYWISAWVERPFGGGGGQWFWLRTTPVTGSEHWAHNPGGGFGFGTSPVPGSSVWGTPANLAFTLEGTAVPAPGAVAIAGLAGLAAARRRR